MSQAAQNYDPHRFRTTVPFYSRYRQPYPRRLIDRVIERTGLEPGDAVLDLGCGPGTLAVLFAGTGMTVTGVDPETAMLEEARRNGPGLTFLEGSSFDLPAGLGPFRLVTMGRSFHWMDREATLARLDGLIVPGGAVALFDDEHPRTVENAWRRTLDEIGRKYGRGEEAHIVERDSGRYRTHESHLLNSPFADLERVAVIVRRRLSVDDIVGLAFSLSTSSPAKLGERIGAFEMDLRAALPEPSYTEIAEMSALIARRGHPPP
jgi:SAM-dependent methyltransferase